MTNNADTAELGRLIYSEIPSAVLENGEYIMKNPRYDELSEMIGNEGMKCILGGESYIFEKKVYSAQITQSGDKTLVILKSEPYYNYLADVSKNLSGLITNIITVIADIDGSVSAVDDFKRSPAVKNQRLKDYLDEIEKGILEIYSKISVIREFSAVRETAAKPKTYDLYDAASVCAENLRLAFEENDFDIPVSVSGKNGIFVRTRLECLRLLFSSAVKDALLGKYSVKSVSFGAGKSGEKAVISMDIAFDKEKKSETEEYFSSDYFKTDTDKITEALADEICTMYNTERKLLYKDENIRMELFFPIADAESYKNDDYSLRVTKILGNSFEKYSPENSKMISVHKTNNKTSD